MDESKKSNRLLRNNMESIILRSLFDGKKYGYEIAREIELKTDGEIEVKNHTTLYNVLKRLENQGLITSFWGDESQGGRRKYFSLTIEGFQLCQKQQSDWEYSRHILDKLVSNKEFDGDKIVPSIDISIDKKVRAPRAPKRRKAEKNNIEEVLDAIDGIAEDLSNLPAEQDESPEDSSVQSAQASRQSEQIAFSDTSDTEDKTEVRDENFLISAPEVEEKIYSQVEEADNAEEALLDSLSEEIDMSDEEPASEYYRDIDRDIDALLEDDEVDNTIISTGDLLDSLSKTVKAEPEPAQRIIERPAGHINMDYLFNLYNNNNNKPAPPSPAPPPKPPVTYVYREEDSAPEISKEYKSFADAEKSDTVDIFDETEEQSEKAPVPVVQPVQEEVYVRNEFPAPPAYVFREEEESEGEKEYKRIINNLLFETRPPKKEEEIVAEHTISKSQTSTADKILSSVDAASYTYNLDAYESTGDIPSGGFIAQQPYASSSPMGIDMLYDLKERLSQEGIKLRQYERAPQTTSERYQFYYKNKVLFATLWIVYALSIIELGVLYLCSIGAPGVIISGQRILAYAFIMLVPPLVGTVINYSRNNVKVRAEWDFGYKIRDALIVFIVGFFVIVSINLLQIFAPFAFSSSNDVVTLLVMPSVMLFNVIIGTFIYFLLYRGKKYFVK